MAPDYFTHTGTGCAIDARSTNIIGTSILYHAGNYNNSKIIETSDEKKTRIAKEKMHSSWKMYQQKTPTIIKVKQLCKPIHRINNHLK